MVLGQFSELEEHTVAWDGVFWAHRAMVCDRSRSRCVDRLQPFFLWYEFSWWKLREGPRVIVFFLGALNFRQLKKLQRTTSPVLCGERGRSERPWCCLFSSACPSTIFRGYRFLSPNTDCPYRSTPRTQSRCPGGETEDTWCVCSA